VEEPEATVHPAVAEVVLDAVMDSAHESQVLVTTHSPDLLDAKHLPDSCIRVVGMENGSTLIRPLSAASRQAVIEGLYTPGELLRINELEGAPECAEPLPGSQDLSEPLPGKQD
jgi:hypothetical protein